MAGPSYRGDGPALERLALSAGIKPALRIQVPATQAEAAARRWRARGLAVEVVGGLIYVARRAEDARALAEVEEPVRPGAARRAPDAEALAAHRELGRRLGYPACCVDAFLARVARGVTTRAGGGEASERYVMVEDALGRSARTLGRLNVLLPRREALVPFDPCRFDCALAARYAEALFEALRSRDLPRADELRARLLRPVALDGPAPITLVPDAF